MYYYKNEAIGTYKEATKKYILSDRALTRELVETYLFNGFDDGYLLEWVADMVVDEGGLTDEALVDYALSYMEDMWDLKEGRMMLGYFGYDEEVE